MTLDITPPNGWRIETTDVPTVGLTSYATRTILIDRHLDATTFRCVLAHEIIHAERGPFPYWLTPHEELIVSRDAARRLITLDELTHALATTSNLDEAAAALNVDRHTLDARIAHLTDTERHTITRHLERTSA